MLSMHFDDLILARLSLPKDNNLIDYYLSVNKAITYETHGTSNFGQDSSFVEIDDDPLIIIMPYQYDDVDALGLSMTLVKNSAKPQQFFGTGDSDEPLKNSFKTKGPTTTKKKQSHRKKRRLNALNLSLRNKTLEIHR
ncbi:hypothetical protein H8356DRAFT_1432374 [Neocallimastix lanati (nom. inval.)]|nr:hypothetical protein H8356DRAFT_1432355 [Neocallimastix sp. JGI-2020a]KAG4089014.1 hypothetical protein H8356DRAFT_1432374 [Neocallimastix sp. JGI-2020a]